MAPKVEPLTEESMRQWMRQCEEAMQAVRQKEERLAAREQDLERRAELEHQGMSERLNKLEQAASGRAAQSAGARWTSPLTNMEPDTVLTWARAIDADPENLASLIRVHFSVPHGAPGCDLLQNATEAVIEWVYIANGSAGWEETPILALGERLLREMRLCLAYSAYGVRRSEVMSRLKSESDLKLTAAIEAERRGSKHGGGGGGSGGKRQFKPRRESRKEDAGKAK